MAADRRSDREPEEEDPETDGPRPRGAFALCDLARREDEHGVEDEDPKDGEAEDERGLARCRRRREDVGQAPEIEDVRDAAGELPEEAARGENEWRDEHASLLSRKGRQAESGDEPHDDGEPDRREVEVVGESEPPDGVIEEEGDGAEERTDGEGEIATADESGSNIGPGTADQACRETTEG